jgi:hypothetical protein
MNELTLGYQPQYAQAKAERNVQNLFSNHENALPTVIKTS